MMMTCHEVRDYLGEFLTGRLTPIECSEFNQHLLVCAECAAHVESARSVGRITRSAVARVEDPGADEVPVTLIRDILSIWHKRRQWGISSGRPFASDPLRPVFSDVPIRI